MGNRIERYGHACTTWQHPVHRFRFAWIFKTEGNHFYFDDGTPFYRLGDTNWQMFRSKNAPFDSLCKPYIDARVAQGCNFIGGVIHTIGDPSINKGGALWSKNNNLDPLQPAYFDWVDRRIEYMLEKDVIPGLYLVWAQTFDDFEQFSRFCNYVIARYAAYNVVWIISEEYSEKEASKAYDYFGNGAGAGVDMIVTPNLTLFVQAKYNVAFGEDDNMTYLPIKAGLIFR